MSRENHPSEDTFSDSLADPDSFATEVFKRIAELYAIEADVRGLSIEERQITRQVRAVPLLLALKARLRYVLSTLSTKSPMAKAIG